MRPQWFTLPTGSSDPNVPLIPFDEMWDADRFWIPLLLADRHFIGRTDFGKRGETFDLLRYWVGVNASDPIPDS